MLEQSVSVSGHEGFFPIRPEALHGLRYHASHTAAAEGARPANAHAAVLHSGIHARPLPQVARDNRDGLPRSGRS